MAGCARPRRALAGRGRPAGSRGRGHGCRRGRRVHGPDRRGDEMPAWVADKTARLERIRAAKAALEAEAKEPIRRPDDEAGPVLGHDRQSGRRNAAKDGGPPERAQRNFTDPDSRIQPDARRLRRRATTARSRSTPPIRSSLPSACQTSPTDACALVPLLEHSGPCSGASPGKSPPTPAIATRRTSQPLADARHRAAISLPAGPPRPGPMPTGPEAMAEEARG